MSGSGGKMAKAMTMEEIIMQVTKWKEDFAAMSEEEQILFVQAQKISLMYGLGSGSPEKDEIAKHVLIKNLGPKFTERVLADPKYRKILGLE